jgi:hypothetical protein
MAMAQSMMNAVRVPGAPGPEPSAAATGAKFCIDCGKPMTGRAKFCPECGAPQP